MKPKRAAVVCAFGLAFLAIAAVLLFAGERPLVAPRVTITNTDKIWATNTTAKDMIIVLLNLEVRGRAGWSTAELFPSIEMNVPRHGVACATMRVTDRPQPESKWRLSGFTYEDQSKKRGVISAIRAYGQIVAQRIRTGNSVFSLNPIGKGVEVHKFKKVVSEEFEEPNNSYATDVSDALFYDFPSPDWVLGRR